MLSRTSHPPVAKLTTGSHRISPPLRAEVESLVSFDRHSDALLVEAVAAGASHAASILQRASLPDRCGPFQPKRLLGQGGMGTVWLAERVDGEVEQVVALKFLQPHLQFPRIHERFIQERRILASLSHSNIARLLDAGHTANAQPYLVMEHIEGQAIDAYCQSLDLHKAPGLPQGVRCRFVRPSNARRPPRSEAIEHPRDSRGRAEAARFRDRKVDHARRRTHRHHRPLAQPRLREPRTGQGRGYRNCCGRIFARSDSLQAAGGPIAAPVRRNVRYRSSPPSSANAT